MIADNLWRSDLSAFTLTCKKFHHMCKESLLEFIIIDDAEQARKIVKDNKSKIEAMNFTETVSIEKKTLYQVDTGELEFSIKMRRLLVLLWRDARKNFAKAGILISLVSYSLAPVPCTGIQAQVLST